MRDGGSVISPLQGCVPKVLVPEGLARRLVDVGPGRGPLRIRGVGWEGGEVATPAAAVSASASASAVAVTPSPVRCRPSPPQAHGPGEDPVHLVDAVDARGLECLEGVAVAPAPGAGAVLLPPRRPRSAAPDAPHDGTPAAHLLGGLLRLPLARRPSRSRGPSPSPHQHSRPHLHQARRCQLPEGVEGGIGSPLPARAGLADVHLPKRRRQGGMGGGGGMGGRQCPGRCRCRCRCRCLGLGLLPASPATSAPPPPEPSQQPPEEVKPRLRHAGRGRRRRRRRRRRMAGRPSECRRRGGEGQDGPGRGGGGFGGQKQQHYGQSQGRRGWFGRTRPQRWRRSRSSSSSGASHVWPPFAPSPLPPFLPLAGGGGGRGRGVPHVCVAFWCGG